MRKVSSPDAKLFDHAMGETDNVVHLLRGTIARAGAPHGF